jgi:spermidine/putrescine transport system permease protein
VNAAVSKNGRRGLWVLYLGLLLFLYTPLVLLIIFSFNASKFVSLPWQGFTLDWYKGFLQNPVLLAALRTSLFVATLAALFTLVLATPASIALVRRRFFGKGFFTGMLMAPLVIPLIVFAIALQVLLKWLGHISDTYVVPFSLVPSKYALIIGHAVIALPFAILTIVPRLERINVALEEAGRDLGGGSLRVFKDITLPLLFPALLSAFVICFTISFDEVVLAQFIAGSDTTLPLYVYSQMRLPQALPQVIAMAVVVLLISGTVIFVSEVFRRMADRNLEEGQKIHDADVEDQDIENESVAYLGAGIVSE